MIVSCSKLQIIIKNFFDNKNYLIYFIYFFFQNLNN